MTPPVPRSMQSVTDLAAALDSDGPCTAPALAGLRRGIAGGADPLGEMFTQARSAVERRSTGTVLTPPAIVDAMAGRAAEIGTPARIVDPGAGTGRFLLAAAGRFPHAELVAFETDRTIAKLLLANVRVRGIGRRLRLETGDFLDTDPGPPRRTGPTLFLGNPPWVRHHHIDRPRKDLTADRAIRLGLPFNRLAGLHVHFMIWICALARPGDYGVLLLPAEWLHTGYGAVLRSMFTGPLDLLSLHLLESGGDDIFPGTLASGSIVCFRVGRPCPAPRMGRAGHGFGPAQLRAGQPVPLKRLAESPKWTEIVRRPAGPRPGNGVVGDLFRVHRGAVTGNNRIWIAGKSFDRVPLRFLVPAVTRARELFQAPDGILSADADLHRLILLPEELDLLDPVEQEFADRFLLGARAHGAHLSWTARSRRPWWRLRLPAPAPVLCSYMARRPPVFVRNDAGAVHLNISHGLYPRRPMEESRIERLIGWLNRHIDPADGRDYAGGLIKFEPGDIARLPLPPGS